MTLLKTSQLYSLLVVALVQLCLCYDTKAEAVLDKMFCYYNDYNNACDSLQIVEDVKNKKIKLKCLKREYHKSYKCNLVIFSPELKKFFRKKTFLTKNAVEELKYNYSRDTYVMSLLVRTLSISTKSFILIFLLFAFISGLAII